MFTGITTLATLTGVDRHGDSARLTVQHRFGQLQDGESIAVNGCCLTVADQQQHLGFGWLCTADLSAETLHRTTLGDLTPGQPVNVERSCTPSSLLGGHLVLGHVDARAEVLELKPERVSTVLTVATPPGHEPYIAEKGSVTLDGASLTVASVTPVGFTVSLIPVTLRNTSLGAAAPGDLLNFEVDALSRYVRQHLDALAPGGRVR